MITSYLSETDLLLGLGGSSRCSPQNFHFLRLWYPSYTPRGFPALSRLGRVIVGEAALVT